MDFKDTLYMLPGIIIGFSLHEYAHAQVATWLGDNTPKYQGRLTTNPFVHIDIIGFLMMIIAGFGWAKPVEINPNNFKNKRRDDLLVSIAGPLMNLAIAFGFLILMKILSNVHESILNETTYEIIMDLLDNAVWMNVVIFVFNLLPIPPLDGFHIFSDIIGLRDKAIYDSIYSKGRFLLLALVITNVFDKIIGPPIRLIYNFLAGLFF
ncbi:MAG: site-2 protease family protein [Clostridiaceae bacterium]|nr:site-2 protease family protein [Clostridiaceae bacterium]